MKRLSKLAYGLVATTAVAVAAYAAVGPGTYSVINLHSNVGFSVPIAGGLSHLQGKFTKYSAAIVYDPSALSKSSVKATIDANSLDTGDTMRDKHTLGKEGFWTAKYPNITFVSKRIDKAGDGFKCTADMTMRGVKKEVVVMFHQTGTRNVGEGVSLIGFEGGFKIDRRDYGLKWEMPGSADWVGDSVEIQISVIARPHR